MPVRKPLIAHLIEFNEVERGAFGGCITFARISKRFICLIEDRMAFLLPLQAKNFNKSTTLPGQVWIERIRFADIVSSDPANLVENRQPIAQCTEMFEALYAFGDISSRANGVAGY